MLWMIPIIIFLDQITKIYSTDVLKYDPIKIWIFELTYVENTGVAFGLFQDRAFLHGVLSTVLVAIMFFIRDFYIKRNKKYLLFDISFCMIIGGAMGNIIDRIRIGFVVDMVFVPYFSVFNVADAFITIGGFLFIVFFVRRTKRARSLFYK